MGLFFGLIGFFVVLGGGIVIVTKRTEESKTEKIHSELFKEYYKH